MRSKKWNSLYIINVISFLDFFAIGLMLPLFFPHLKSLGTPDYLMGVFGSVYSSVQTFSAPVIGSWSDVRGHRFVLIATLCISASAYFLCGLTSSILTIFILRVILGLTKHTQILCRVFILNETSPDGYSNAFAQITTISGLGFVVGPIFGGHLIVKENGFFLVSSFAACLFLCNIGLAAHLPENHTRKKESRTVAVANGEIAKVVAELRALDWKKYWDVLLLRFLYRFALSTYLISATMFMETRFHVSKVHIGYTISFVNSVQVLSAFLFRNTTRLKMIEHFYLALGLVFLAMNFIRDFYIYVALMVPFSLCCSFLRLKTTELVLLRAQTSGQTGSLSGIASSVMSLAKCLAPLTLGLSDGGNIAPLLAFVPAFVGYLLCKKVVAKGV